MLTNTPGNPKSLFKYFGPDRVDVLLTRMLKFTPLGEFNDLFEGKPRIKGLTTEEVALEAFEEIMLEEIERSYNSLPLEARAIMPREQFLTLAPSLMRENFPELLNKLQEVGAGISHNLPDMIDKIMGALCLSEAPDSMLMWAHYGANHTGFALELNANHSYFHQQRSDKDEFRHIRQVNYRDTRPSGVLTDLDGSDVFLTKCSTWSYEREWRMFMPLADADSIIETHLAKIYLYRIPSDAIVGIILGARASEQLIEKVRNFINRSPELSHVLIRSCKPDETQFALQIS